MHTYVFTHLHLYPFTPIRKYFLPAKGQYSEVSQDTKNISAKNSNYESIENFMETASTNRENGTHLRIY